MKLKGEGKYFKGAIKNYGNVPANWSIYDIAIDYVTNPNHADYYFFPAQRRGGRGGHAGNAKVLVYHRASVEAAVRHFADGARNYGVLGTHNGGICLMRYEYSAMRQTFGAPVAELDAGLASWKELQPAYTRPNAPYARAFELLIARLTGGKDVGGLRNVQIDLVFDETAFY